ncbi:MAG: Holliday junction resolvase-like protein [Planctomycetota bacterium]|nr:Holliday junction resolvase-like protein [Planctomycetota bacterium]
MEVITIALICLIAILLAGILILLLRPRKIELPQIQELEQKLRFALASETSMREVQNDLRNLPNQLLLSITRSLGKRTGKLNELMATFELTQYDRLFYLGEPIDFVGIKYDEGVDFIEVKTGRFRLTGDEQRLRNLIEEGKVNYVPLSVERIGIAEEADLEE